MLDEVRGGVVRRGTADSEPAPGAASGDEPGRNEMQTVVQAIGSAVNYLSWSLVVGVTVEQAVRAVVPEQYRHEATVASLAVAQTAVGAVAIGRTVYKFFRTSPRPQASLADCG